MPKRGLTSGKVTLAVRRLISDPGFAREALAVSEILRDPPESLRLESLLSELERGAAG